MLIYFSGSQDANKMSWLPLSLPRNAISNVTESPKFFQEEVVLKIAAQYTMFKNAGLCIFGKSINAQQYIMILKFLEKIVDARLKVCA